MKEQILQAITEALKSINQARFFRTERGYHGRFYCGLQNALDARGILNDKVILEMEYQKSARHGTLQRPDIVLHTPAESHGLPVGVGNFVVFALKHRASPNDAQTDFNNLDIMFERLNYLLGVFINVDSPSHHLQMYEGEYRSRLHSFGVQSKDGVIRVVHAFYSNDAVVENVI